MISNMKTWLEGESARDLSLLFLRLALAAVFTFHGAQKLFGLFGGGGLEGTAQFMGSLGIPFPLLSATLAGSAEFFGGLAVGAGVLARLASVPMAFTMLTAMATAHQGFAASAGGVEFPLTLLFALIVVGLQGPGRFSLGAVVAARVGGWPRVAAGSPA